MSKPALIAAPNRVILKFPPVKKETYSKIIVPDKSLLRPEIAEIVDIGEPVGELQVACAEWLKRLKDDGIRVPISYQSGVRYWRDTYESEPELAQYGAFLITEIASALINHPDYPVENKQ